MLKVVIYKSWMGIQRQNYVRLKRVSEHVGSWTITNLTCFLPAKIV